MAALWAVPTSQGAAGAAAQSPAATQTVFTPLLSSTGSSLTSWCAPKEVCVCCTTLFPPFLACACTCMVAVDKTCGMVQEHARRSPAAAGAAPRRPRPSDPADVFVLDFDGVIVNSEPEVLTCSYHQPKTSATQ